MKYYKVTAKCGHVGKNYFVEKNLYIKAEDGKSAALKARQTPRVKHDKKDAIIKVTVITFEDYLYGLKINAEDPYFHVTNKQQQNALCKTLYQDIVKEPKKVTYKKKHILRNLRDNCVFNENVDDWEELYYESR